MPGLGMFGQPHPNWPYISLYDCFVIILLGYLVIMAYTQHMLFLRVDNVTDIVFSNMDNPRVLATRMDMIWVCVRISTHNQV